MADRSQPDDTPATPSPARIDWPRNLDAEAMRRRIGERLFGGDERPTYLGRFRVLRTLGVGGMGVVYAAEDDVLDRVVALKVIRDDVIQRGGDRQRIVLEARALARLSHPNVVQLHEIVTDSEAVFLVMEYIAGTTLSQWLHAEPRSVAEILATFAAAGRGLAAAHRVGIVHRDVKPSNILFGDDGRVRIVDFGLARGVAPGPLAGATPTAESATPRSPVGADATESGAIAGTPAYMAPEAFFAGKVDARSDQFSFCVALYESLYGERPFGPDVLSGPESLRRGLTFPGAPHVRASVRRLLARGLSARPADRFASMEELTAGLEARPRSRWGIVGLLTAGLLGGAVLLGQAGDEPASRCAPPSGELAGMWDAAARNSVRKAMLRHGQPFSALVGPVEEQLDRYALRWSAARHDACEATWVRGEQSTELLDRSMHCLSQRRHALAGLVDRLQGGDPRVAALALELAHDLPDIGACRDSGRLLHGRARGTDDPRLASVRSTLVQATALEWSREAIAAVALANAALTELRAIGEPVTEAEALQLRGRLLARELGDIRAGLADLHAAYDRAAAAGDDPLRARIWAELAEFVAGFEQDPAEARRLLTHAREAAGRQGAPSPADEARLLDTEGRILSFEERFAGSLELHTRALELRRAHLAPGHPDLVRSRLRVANASADAGQPEVAMRLCGELGRDVAARFGADHPATALIEVAEAQHLVALRRTEEARARLLHARPLLLRGLGPRTPQLAVLDLELADLDADLGELPRAIARARDALALVTALLPPHHDLRIEALAALAGYHQRAGDCAGALDILRELLVLHEKKAVELDLGLLLYNLGDCLCLLGRCAEGNDYFMRLLALYPPPPPTSPALPTFRPVRRALALYGLGFVHLEAGRPELALPSLEHAKRLLDADPDELPHVAVDVTRLLARSLVALHREPRRVRALRAEADAAARRLAPTPAEATSGGEPTPAR